MRDIKMGDANAMDIVDIIAKLLAMPIVNARGILAKRFV